MIAKLSANLTGQSAFTPDTAALEAAHKRSTAAGVSETSLFLAGRRYEGSQRLLPLYDLLLSAHNHINSARDGGGSDDVLKGLEMIFKEFSKVFEAEGLRQMEPVGKPYDPMASEILGVVEGTDENDGLVTEELQKGFYYGDKILRPARVKIAKKKAEPAPQPEPEPEQKPAEEEGQ